MCYVQRPVLLNVSQAAHVQRPLVISLYCKSHYRCYFFIYFRFTHRVQVRFSFILRTTLYLSLNFLYRIIFWKFCLRTYVFFFWDDWYPCVGFLVTSSPSFKTRLDPSLLSRNYHFGKISIRLSFCQFTCFLTARTWK